MVSARDRGVSMEALVGSDINRGPALGRTAPGVVLAVASLGVFMAFVDDTVVTIAFPNMVRSFHHAKLAELSWVLNVYNIALAALMVPAGRFADALGRRRVYLLGLTLFTLGSGLSAVAPSLGSLIAARGLQGIGAAIIVPGSLAIVLHGSPPQRRTESVAIWSATAALAAGLGPAIGGGLVDLSSWRLVFLINLPIGAVAWFLARRLLDESRARGYQETPDLQGSVLLALSVGAVTLAIVQGPDWGWVDVRVLAAAAVAVIVAGLLVRRVRHTGDAVLDPELLRTRGVPLASLISLVGATGFFALGVGNVLFLIEVWHYSPLRTGLATTPAPFAAAAAAGLAAQLSRRVDARRLVLVGCAVWTLGPIFLLARATSHPDYLGAYLPAAVLSAIGIGLGFPLVADAAISLAPRGRYAGASALNGAIRQLGGVIGVAILAALLGHAARGASVDPYHPVWWFAAGCFACIGLASLRLAPIGAPDLLLEADELMALRDALPAIAPAAMRTPPGQSPRPNALSDAELLAGAPIFRDLDPPAREALAGRATVQRLSAGQWLFRAGEQGDSLYIVRSGRLEVLFEREGGESDVIRELGRGSVVGELAILAGGPRSASVRARRDAVLLRIDRDGFQQMLDTAPGFAAAVARSLGAQLGRSRPRDPERPAERSTIAFIRRPGDGPAAALQVDVISALRRLRHVVALFPDKMLTRAPRDVVGIALAETLDRAEAQYELVVLSAEWQSGNPWLESCLRQADRIVFVLEPGAESWLTGPERELLRGCDVVLLEPPPPVVASPAAAVAGLLDELAPRSIQRVAGADDLARLARRLAGRSVGLVLSGGGARAFTHIGVLAELEAAGITVDRIGGASMGAMIGAMVASGRRAEEIELAIYREFVRRNPLGDYRLPRESLIRGARFRAMLERQLTGLIEDLPRPFFCVTTDIITAELVVHRRGELVTAVGASMSLPGIAPAVVMGQRLLVDGGVLDNLPVAAMLEEQEGPVIACDVTEPEQRSLAPGEPPPRISIVDTLTRVMLLGTTDTEAEARRLADLVITPERGTIGRLEWHMLDEAVLSGRRAAIAALQNAPAALFG